MISSNEIKVKTLTVPDGGRWALGETYRVCLSRCWMLPILQVRRHSRRLISSRRWRACCRALHPWGYGKPTVVTVPSTAITSQCFTCPNAHQSIPMSWISIKCLMLWFCKFVKMNEWTLDAKASVYYNLVDGYAFLVVTLPCVKVVGAEHMTITDGCMSCWPSHHVVGLDSFFMAYSLWAAAL